MNHILRDIKLSKITDTPLSEKASKIINFWDGLWTDMKVIVDADKGEIKCWKNDYDYYYFHQDDKNSHLWCNHYRVWSFFRNELGIKYAEVQELIQYMVGETLNCGVNTPWNNRPFLGLSVSESLNCGVNTPTVVTANANSLVGETLRYKVNN